MRGGVITSNGSVKHGRVAFVKGRAPTTACFSFEDWRVDDVLNWLEGVDGNPSLAHAFKHGRVDGKKLACLDDSHLRRMRVTREVTRIKVLRALALLEHYSSDVLTENLQRLAMQTGLSALEFNHAVSYATPIITDSLDTQRIVEVLTSVLRAVGDLHQKVMDTLLWLDRRPFDGVRRFQRIREELFVLTEEVVECIINPSNPKLASIPQALLKKGKQIQQLCDRIVFDSDPYILSTAYFECVKEVKIPSANATFTSNNSKETNAIPGFEVGCTLSGLHLLTKVDPCSMIGNMEVGDEIVQVNGTTVVGWQEAALAKKLAEKNTLGSNRELLLLKRPRCDWQSDNYHRSLRFNRPRILLSPVDTEDHNLTMEAVEFGAEEVTETSLALSDFKLKASLLVHNPTGLGIKKRSASLSTFPSICERPVTGKLERQLTVGRCLSLLIADKRAELLRRASVWSESPPAALLAKSPFVGIQSGSNAWLLLLASWSGGQNKGRTRAKKPARLHIRSAEDTTVIADLLDSAEEAQGLLEFCQVDLVVDSELRALRITTPSIQEPEWSQPILEDITGLSILLKRPIYMEASSSSFSIMMDSPLSTIQAKISKFFYGDLTISTNLSAAVSAPQSVVGTRHSTPPPLHVLTPTDKDMMMSTSFASDPCKTPLTPISRFSSEMLFIAGNTRGGSAEEGGTDGESSSITTVESPLPTIPRVRTIASRRKVTLAPLAEPDEVREGDFFSLANETEQVAKARVRLDELASIPCAMLESVVAQGWVKRQRLDSDRGDENAETGMKTPRKKRSQWVKTWMSCTRDNILYLYPNDKAQRSDIVIALNLVDYVTRAVSIKTSKKFVLALVWGQESLNLAFPTEQELLRWYNLLVLLPKNRSSPAPSLSTGAELVESERLRRASPST